MTGSPDGLETSDKLFHLLLDHVCVAGFDGYWKRVNPAWTHTLGWSAEELMGRPLIEFVHPDDRERTLGARANLHTGEPLLSFTNRYLHKDGGFRWFEWRSVADPARQLVYAVARDVTEAHENRLALRALTESLEATFASIADGLIVTDRLGRIVRINPVAELLTGWPAGEAVGRPADQVLRIMSDGESARPLAPIERTLVEGMRSTTSAHPRLLTRDGKAVPIAYSQAPMTDDSGTVSGSVFVFRDMTAEERSEQEQEQLRQQIIRADRMASVGTLAAGVGHEVNNPLAYVTSNLEMIIEELESLVGEPPSAHLAACIKMAVQAREGAARIDKIVRGLSTFSREEKEHSAPIELRPVLELSIELAFNEIRHRARLVKDFGPTPLVVADGSRLGQVFVNLLVNAAQAIQGGGEAHEVGVHTRTDADGNAVVEIRDTGAGISPQVIDRIFDPFFTTKPVGVGTGLGLAVCHNIIEAIGGTIVAANLPEGGASFRLTLPAAAAAAARAESPATAAGPIVSEPSGEPVIGARVLVVDDEKMVGAALRRVLRVHDVTTVTSAHDALALIAEGATYDVIFSDLMMPDMSGMGFFEVLRSAHPHLAERVVFITGGAFTDDARGFLEEVPNTRISKPFAIDAVRRMVERLAVEQRAKAGA